MGADRWRTEASRQLLLDAARASWMDLSAACRLHGAAGHGRAPMLMMDSDGRALMIAADP